MRAFIIVIVLVFVSILASTSILAQETMNESKRNDFNARLQHLQCKIQLTETQVDLFSSLDTNLSSQKAVLDADYAKLQELASVLNHKEFDAAVKSFRENLKNVVKSVRQAKMNYRQGNLTQEQKKELRENHKTAISVFANCTTEAARNWSEARIGYLNAWINRWSNVAAKMKEQGLNVTEMEAVVADIQNKLLPAVEAIRNATPQTRKSLMENARSLHLHLAARFEIVRIRAYLVSIEANATAYSSEVAMLKSKLDEAGKLAIPGKKYAPGEYETVWTAIKGALQMLKDLNNKLKG